MKNSRIQLVDRNLSSRFFGLFAKIFCWNLLKDGMFIKDHTTISWETNFYDENTCLGIPVSKKSFLDLFFDSRQLAKIFFALVSLSTKKCLKKKSSKNMHSQGKKSIFSLFHILIVRMNLKSIFMRMKLKSNFMLMRIK